MTTIENERHGSHQTRRDIAREYAAKVRAHAAVTSKQSLYPGDDFRHLADFLWQPYNTQLNLPKRAAARDSYFASLYKIGGDESVPLSCQSFATVEEFQQLHDRDIFKTSTFPLLVLRGYPGPEWLNFLGGRFNINPEFFQRHLLFASVSGKNTSKNSPALILPSCHANMVSLQVTNVGLRQSGIHPDRDQGTLGAMRADASNWMAAYMSKLASLDSSEIPTGNLFAREFSLLDFDSFLLEHTVSLYIHTVTSGRKIGIVWDDGGQGSTGGVRGPWQTGAPGTTSSEPKYLPTPVRKPGIALRGRTYAQGNVAAAQTRTSKSPTPVIESIFDDHSIDTIPPGVHESPFFALRPFFDFAVSSEMAALDMIDAKIRNELDRPGASLQNPSLPTLVYLSQVLKRHARKLAGTICSVDVIKERVWIPDQAVARLILADYHAALSYAESLVADCSRGVTIAAHNATIQESEKAVAEARDVTRLTKLASIFVPLGFVTGVFSMNINPFDRDGNPAWWWALSCVVVGAVTWALFKYDIRRESWTAWRLCVRMIKSPSAIRGRGKGIDPGV